MMEETRFEDVGVYRRGHEIYMGTCAPSEKAKNKSFMNTMLSVADGDYVSYAV